MWVMALLGAASAFVESTLSQIYKSKVEMNIAVVHRISLKRLKHEMVCSHCSGRCNTFIWCFITRYSI